MVLTLPPIYGVKTLPLKRIAYFQDVPPPYGLLLTPFQPRIVNTVLANIVKYYFSLETQ